MATVTEKDIIDHLREKIKFHQNEAKRIESLLSAFTSNSDQQKVRKKKIEAVGEAIEPLPDKATKGKVKKEKAPKAPKSAKKLQSPPEYNDSLSISEKIAFALKEIGSGFNDDIAAAMAQYEPQSDAKKISKQISGVLSTLKTKGMLSVSREGRKDKYTLV
jgi:hypothetical protein